MCGSWAGRGSWGRLQVGSARLLVADEIAALQTHERTREAVAPLVGIDGTVAVDVAGRDEQRDLDGCERCKTRTRAEAQLARGGGGRTGNQRWERWISGGGGVVGMRQASVRSYNVARPSMAME